MIFNHHRYCLQQLHDVIRAEISGNVMECGIGRGNNSLQMAAWIRDMGVDKVIFAMDTFDGLPYTDEDTSHIKSNLKKGECIHVKFDEFIQKRSKLELEHHCIPIQGLIEKTLPDNFDEDTICFAWLDVDLYMPTLFAWEFLKDKIPAGGIMGIHDYKYWRCPGIEEIVKEVIEPDKEWTKCYEKGTSIFFRKL